jgi:hypothetical protein
MEGLRFQTGVRILAGRFQPAARWAYSLTEALRSQALLAHSNDGLRRWYEERAQTTMCLALALDARSGDQAAAWSLREWKGPLTPGCAVLRLDSLQGSERVRAFHDLPGLWADVHDVPRAWLLLLAAEADPRSAWEIPLPFDSAAEVLAIPNGEPLARMLPGVERHLFDELTRIMPEAERLAAECEKKRTAEDLWPACETHSRSPHFARIRAAASAAMFALLAGDQVEGRALAHAALDSHQRLGPNWTGRPDEIVAVAALPGDPQPAAQAVASVAVQAVASVEGEFLHGLLDVAADRDASAIVRALERRPPPDEDEKRAWSFAAAGDGASLSRWLRRPISQPGTFLRFGAPLLRADHDDLAKWVRWGYRPIEAFRPTEEVVHLATLAAAAEALGPAEAAAALRERTRRFREAILRRDTAVLLAVLERL